VNYPSASTRYRESDILAATPGRLVVLTFDGLLAACTRARVGIEMKNYDVTLPALDKARTILGELLVTLDVDRGGLLAEQLSSIYVFVLSELQALGVSPDSERLERNIKIIRELRDAFAEISHTPRVKVA
jgi:flagellar protein FliS